MNTHSLVPNRTTDSEISPADAPARRGRSRFLPTAEMIHNLFANIRAFGLSDLHAAVHAGIGSSTLAHMKEDEEFCDLLAAARAEFEVKRVSSLLEATKPDGSCDWRAQAWLLRNSSREGGWGRATDPLKDAAPRKPEILPNNTPAPAAQPEALDAPALQKPEIFPKNPVASASHAASPSAPVSHKAENLPKNTPTPAPALQPAAPNGGSPRKPEFLPKNPSAPEAQPAKAKCLGPARTRNLSQKYPATHGAGFHTSSGTRH